MRSTLKQPGSVVLGHAFLQPGEWGRFKGLPVRRDVAEGLIDQGITVLRYGGSMVNNGGYSWKKMIGPRDRRPPYAGTWYRYSSNGWGILDFMDFCEAAGFEYVPASTWTKRRRTWPTSSSTPRDRPIASGAASGSPTGIPKPYRLHYMELGNEERVDEEYAAKFEALAKAIWAKDPDVILVVGDFAYGQPIHDPMNFTGAARDHQPGRAADRSCARPAARPRGLVRRARRDGRPGTVKPRSKALPTFIDALDKIADGAKHKVVVFEYNAGNHADAAGAGQRAGHERHRARRPPADRHLRQLPAARRPERQRLGPGSAVPQPVAGLAPAAGLRDADALAELPAATVKCEVTGAEGKLDVDAKRSEDGKTLVLQVVNLGDKAVTPTIQIAGFVPSKPVAQVTTLSGPLDAVNTADKPNAVVPSRANGSTRSRMAGRATRSHRFVHGAAVRVRHRQANPRDRSARRRSCPWT